MLVQPIARNSLKRKNKAKKTERETERKQFSCSSSLDNKYEEKSCFFSAITVRRVCEEDEKTD